MMINQSNDLPVYCDFDFVVHFTNLCPLIQGEIREIPESEAKEKSYRTCKDCLKLAEKAALQFFLKNSCFPTPEDIRQKILGYEKDRIIFKMLNKENES
jgi:hypothetical protein